MPSLTGADTAAAIAEPVSVQEAEAFLAEHPEIHFIDLLIADMNGIVRGKRIDRSALLKASKKVLLSRPPSSP